MAIHGLRCGLVMVVGAVPGSGEYDRGCARDFYPGERLGWDAGSYRMRDL